jgi:DNA-3-methyladenine glycosylase II
MGDVYKDLLRAIISQQLSLKAAATIYGRFLNLFENQNPLPESISNLSIEALRSVGLSKQKAEYVQNVASYFRQEQIKPWQELSDEEVLQELTSIKGVGKWTAEMILIFSLDRKDIFPIDDLGIRQMMIKLYEVETSSPKETAQKLTAIAEKWRPYRSIACFFLWQFKDGVVI